MSITLPPLPEPAGTLVPPAMTAGSSWYSHGYTADQLRARDLEVARAVLEASAKVADGFSPSERQSYIEYCPDAIRALEVRHHE